MLGNAHTIFGANSSSKDYFPVTDPDPTNSLTWVVGKNANSVPNVLPIVSDMIITRFDITNLSPPLSASEYKLDAFSNSICPNPSSGILVVESDYDISQVEVYNLAGRKVFFHSTEQPIKKLNLDISHLSSGLYLVKINGYESQAVVKL